MGKRWERSAPLNGGALEEGISCRMTGAIKTSEDHFFPLTVLPQLEREGRDTSI